MKKRELPSTLGSSLNFWQRDKPAGIDDGSRLVFFFTIAQQETSSPGSAKLQAKRI